MIKNRLSRLKELTCPLSYLTFHPPLITTSFSLSQQHKPRKVKLHQYHLHIINTYPETRKLHYLHIHRHKPKKT